MKPSYVNGLTDILLHLKKHQSHEIERQQWKHMETKTKQHNSNLFLNLFQPSPWFSGVSTISNDFKLQLVLLQSKQLCVREQVFQTFYT